MGAPKARALFQGLHASGGEVLLSGAHLQPTQMEAKETRMPLCIQKECVSFCFYGE